MADYIPEEENDRHLGNRISLSEAHVITQAKATHKRDGRNEIIFDRRIMLKHAHVHAEESNQECKR